jgi:hypothetical protein
VPITRCGDAEMISASTLDDDALVHAFAEVEQSGNGHQHARRELPMADSPVPDRAKTISDIAHREEAIFEALISRQGLRPLSTPS